MADMKISQTVALASGSFLSGAMASISLIAVPTCMKTVTSSALLCRQWDLLFYYGHLGLPAIAVSTCGMYLSMAYRAPELRAWYGVAGAVTVVMVPFTWVLMTPTNNRLFGLVAQSKAAGGDDVVELAEAQKLVRRWGRMHLVRSLFPLIGAAMGLLAIV